MQRIDVFDTPELLTAAAGELFFELGHQAINERGRFNALLSGGSTPRAVYQWLARHGEMLDWQHVRLFFGDERCVPPDHVDSNYRMAHEAMLDTLEHAGVKTFRIPGEMAPDVAAANYEATLRAEFTELPRFDLVFLGLGADAHTASLFPHTKAIGENDRWFVANYAASQGQWRITATPPVINNARVIAFLVTGAGKADAVESVINGPRDAHVYPAQIVQPWNGDVRWMLDVDAARRVSGKHS